MFTNIWHHSAKPRAAHLVGVALVLLMLMWVPLKAQDSGKITFTPEEYASAVYSLRMNSLTSTMAEKRKTLVWLEEAKRSLQSFQNKALTPDSRTTDIGGAVRIISNERLRREAETSVKKVEERIQELQKQLLIVETRASEFEKCRARGFMPLRNGIGKEINASPVGFKNGEILFVTQDPNLTQYSFPIDDISYGSLVEVVKFIEKHAQDGSLLLDDTLKLNEKAFFERLAKIDVNLNIPVKKESGQFIATRAPTTEDATTNAAYAAQLESYRADLRKYELADGAPFCFTAMEADAEKTTSPALHHFLAQHYLENPKTADLDKARQWAGRAARAGYTPAYTTLGNLYNESYLLSCGFPKEKFGHTDYTIARQWYEKAAENYEPSGYWALGKMYLWGTGVRQDDTTAIEYIRQAALVSDKVYAPQACFMLGILYYQGRGIEKDHEKAIWWLRACANINPDSQVATLAKNFLSRNTFEVTKK